MQSSLPELKPRLVGSRVPRVEDPRLLTGRGRYIADIALPRMLHVAFVRSPVAHARIVSVETAEARALPGVRAVWTSADVPPSAVGIPAVLQGTEDMATTVQPILAGETVTFVGEPIVAIAADSRALAEDAAALVGLELEELPAVVDAEAALAGEAVANEQVPGNVVLDRTHESGDHHAAFAAADVVVSGRYTSARSAAVPMETRGCIADANWATGETTLWSSTQMPHFFRSLISMFTGLPEHSLTVIAPDVGGGFGQKSHLFPEELLLPLMSRALGRPLKWIEDRAENLIVATHAKQQVNEMSLAFTSEGRLTGMRSRIVGDGGAYSTSPWTLAVECMAAAGTITSVYDVPSLQTHFSGVLTNKVPIGAYRGIGWQAPQIAREALLDRAARELGLSPFELRRRNVVQPDQFPYQAATGLWFTEGSYRESLDKLEEVVGYEAFLERQARERAAGRYLGLGISVFNELTGMGSVSAFATGFNVTSHDTSTVRMEPNGSVTVYTSVVSQGQSHETTLAQIAADSLGVPLDQVVVRAGDSRQTYGVGTWGSRGGVIGGGSIMRAAEPIRAKLVATAAHMLEAAPQDIELADGRIGVVGAPEQSMSIADVAGVVYFAKHVRPPDMDPTLEATAAYDPADLVLANGAQAAIVEVDVGTGIVTVEKLIAVEDCGTMINPMVVEGQIVGGLAQAIGAVLLEEMVYDDAGQLLTTTFADYLIPTMTETAPVEIHHLETPSKVTPGGMKGMGESAMISGPAAIANAVNDALHPLGVHLTEVPFSPDRILTALATRTPEA